MSSKNKVIIVGFFLVFLNILAGIYCLVPRIEMTINGDKNIILSIGEEYKEKGAEAKLKNFFSSKNLDINISGKVNNNELGKYVITYESSNASLSKEMIRVVNVVDDIKPVIKLENEIIGCQKNNLLNFEATAYDNYDGIITEKVKYKINNNEIIFSVSDSSSNYTELNQKIKYIDNEKPQITLIGSQTIPLLIGEEYEEYGATATDSCDGDLSSNITIANKVNINIPGIYEVTYSVKDSFGNETSETRYVTVYENEENYNNEYKIENGATIYLTFDDGPGPYTEELLNILDEYNVKATFFVTGQFSKYQHLIKEEYKRGHTVGIHTFTHKWTIYDSVESYLDDFNKIEEIVFQETGVHSKIFRFPGGSSNTISKKHSKGIMTELSKLMEEKGYIYFDWTFDSGDTSKKNNSVKDIIKNVKSGLKGDGNYIILMHDIKQNTVKALPEIIKYAKSKGYEFDKLNENSPIKHFKIAN